MSGYKRATVKISEEEYRRLHQADIERRFRTHTRAAKKSAQQVGNLTHALREMEYRQQQLERAITILDQEVDGIGSEMIHDVLAQNAHCYENLAALIEETASENNASLAMVSQRFTETMDIERERYHQQIQALAQRLETDEEREQSKAEAARQWLTQSVAFAEFLQGQFDHERFLPGRLAKIINSLSFAQYNLTQDLVESSIHASQQAFLQLSELHFELEQSTVEWHTEYEQASTELIQFIDELEMNASVNAFGLAGEELTEQVDLAYWSNGKYQELLDKSRQLLTLLRGEQRAISTEELRQTHTQLLPVIREKFETIIYEARLHALNSQLRMNIAERALQALEIHGFRLHNSGYTDKDMRAAFRAQLENSDGSRVMIEVLPAQQSRQDLTNELVVITKHPHLKTEHEARLQWQELCRTLNQYDLHVSHPEVRAAPAAPVLTIEEPVENTVPLQDTLSRSKRHQNV